MIPRSTAAMSSSSSDRTTSGRHGAGSFSSTEGPSARSMTIMSRGLRRRSSSSASTRLNRWARLRACPRWHITSSTCTGVINQINQSISRLITYSIDHQSITRNSSADEIPERDVIKNSRINSATGRRLLERRVSNNLKLRSVNVTKTTKITQQPRKSLRKFHHGKIRLAVEFENNTK